MLQIFRNIIRKEYYSLGAIVGIGILARLYKLGIMLSGDELGQFLVAERDTVYGAIQGAQLHYGAMPLDYILLHYFLYLGKSSFMARLPAALYGIAAIVVFYALVKMVWNERVALISALLLALSGFHVQYSQIARFYSLFALLSLVTFYFFYRAVVKDRDARAWVLFTVSAIASLYSHVYTFFALTAQFTFLAGMVIYRQIKKDDSAGPCWKDILKFIACNIVVLIAFIPWFWTALEDSKSQYFHHTDIPVLLYLRTLLSAFSTGISETIDNVHWTVLQWNAALAFLAAALIGVFSAFRKGFSSGFFILTWFLVPIPFMMFLIIKANYFFAARQFLFLLPAYLISAALGLQFVSELVGRKWARPVFAALMSIFILLNGLALKQYYIGRKEIDLSKIESLAHRLKKNDVIMYDGKRDPLYLQYYLTLFNKNIKFSYLPWNKYQLTGATVIPMPATDRELDELLKRYDGFWFYGSMPLVSGHVTWKEGKRLQ